MKTHRHHLGGATETFLIERIERVAKIGLELLARIEALRCGEPHVVSIKCIGDNELVLLTKPYPIWQIISVAIGDISKLTIFGNQAQCVFLTAACIPTARGTSNHGGVKALGGGDLRALLAFGHIFVFDPFQPVRGDLPRSFLHRRNLIRASGERTGYTIDGDGKLSFGKEPMQAPKTRPRPIFINRFHVPMALTRPSASADDLGQEGFGGGISMEGAILAALFIVHDELHSDARPSRPVGRRGACAIAAKIAWIGCQGDPPQNHLIGKRCLIFSLSKYY